MSLLFDLTASQPNYSGKRHGGGKYCEMVFLRMCDRSEQFQVFYDSSKYINPQIMEYKDKVKFWDISKTTLSNIVCQNNITHIYSALPEFIQPWPNCKILGTIHGLRCYEMPFDFFANWQLDSGLIGFNTFLAFYHSIREKKRIKAYYQSLLNTKQFIFNTVSEHSKKIIQPFCPKKNIPVFYSPSTSKGVCLKNKINPYFLLVSANRAEKNCIRALIALDKLYEKHKIPNKIKVKITGLSASTFRYSLKNPKQFDFLGYVEENELNNLYENSRCLIYPSLNEGFGYPPIEAMQYGTPIIASNRSSIPEVCGDAAIYIDPTSICEIQEAIVRLSDEKIYNFFSKKSLQQYQIISEKQKKDLDLLIDWILENVK